jgi:hypothetical protein
MKLMFSSVHPSAAALVLASESGKQWSTGAGATFAEVAWKLAGVQLTMYWYCDSCADW